MTKHCLLYLTVICATLLFATCTRDDSYFQNCEDSMAEMRVNNRVIPLQILSSTLLRTNNGSGNFKLLSVEAFIDTVKVVLNIADGYYTSNDQLQIDSLRTRTYTYTQQSNKDTSGLVLVGVRQGQSYAFHTTDSASVTITGVDTQKRTVSGYFYFRTTSPVATATGNFSNVCFLSIR